jgi:predicted dehydrogenase
MAIGLGVMGFAHGHAEQYLRVWRAHFGDRVRPLVGTDRDPDRRDRVAAEDRMKTAPDSTSLLARSDVDAVLIASETAYHAEDVEAAARAGKAIVLQKPIALTMEQADRIVEAVTRAGVPFTMTWQMRVDPQNQRMKELVQDGTVGRVFMLRRRHGLTTQKMPGIAGSWHTEPALNRGMWADDAAHAADFLLWMLGPPASVCAEVETLHDPAVPDDNAIAVYRYEDGTLAEVVSSFVCLAGQNTTEIVGENGVVIQNYGDGPSAHAPGPRDAAPLKWYREGDEAWTVSKWPAPETQAERIAGLAQPLLEFLEGARPPVATAEEGRVALRMILAAHEAARRGRRVSLAEI